MAQTGFTSILLFGSTTASAVPPVGNLALNELALNTTDGKMYFKNTGGAVTLLASVLTAVANGGTGVTTSTGSGSVVLNTSPSLVTPVVDSLNGGPLAGMRNRIINGGMQVAQRTVATLSNTFQFGSVDRLQAAAITGTGISGSITQFQSAAFASGYFMAIANASWTSGNVQFSQKIEARNTQDLNTNKTITVSCRIFQDTGAARTMQFALFKANSADNFSGVTQIGSAFGATSIPSGGTYSMSGSIALASLDALNGLQIIIQDSAVNTVVNKNYYIGDLQLELGSVATPFEQRPIGLELSLCQRYFEQGTVRTISYSAGATNNSASSFGFLVSKRSTPTMSFIGTPAFGNATAVAFNSPVTNGCGTDIFAGGAGITAATFTFAANAEL